MRKLILLFVTWGLSLLMIGFLDNPDRFGQTEIPAMGRLLSPSHGYLQNSDALGDIRNWNFPSSVVDPDALLIRDSNYIPHIFANNDLDAYKLQGFIEAIDRFWQMDFVTRATAGRLSEIFGEKALDFDQDQRRKGLLLAAKRTLKKWQEFPESYSYLTAYTEGVNSYFKQLSYSSYPIEYKILGYEPEEWTPLKTALFFKYMSDVLCSRESDFEMYNAQHILGQEDYTFFFDRRNPHDVPVIREQRDTTWYAEVRQNEANDSTQLGKVPKRPYELHPGGVGSNNWAVSAQRSKTGNVLFANDPHLPLKIPSVWYLIHLKTPSQNVLGVSFPGTPGITLGFNTSLSWGITNVGHDVLDWLEVDWSPGSSELVFEEKSYPITWIKDTFLLRDGSLRFDSTAWTEWGPIWELPSATGSKHAVMHWLGHVAGVTDDLSVFPGLNRSSNLEQFETHLANFESPASNFAVGTSDGDIGLFVQGRLPDRTNGHGKMLRKLDPNRPSWTGYIPQAHLPQSVNPDLGFVSSANQVSTNSEYPYYYVIGDRRSERGRTINAFFDSKEKFDRQDMRDLQMLTYHVTADDIVKATEDFLKEQGERGNQLINWNKNFESESEEATLWTIWMEFIRKYTFDELEQENEVRQPGLWVIAELYDVHREHAIFDIKSTSDVQENREDILELSWSEAISRFDSLANKEWYKYRNTTIPHIIEPLKAFGISEVRAGGTSKAPLALTSVVGPSWRLVHEPGSDKPAWGVYPGGQSGHPGSAHYLDYFEPWRKGEFLSLELYENAGQIDNPIQVVQNPKQ